MPGAKFLSGSICSNPSGENGNGDCGRETTCRYRRDLGDRCFQTNMNWFEDKGSQFRAKAWSALKKGSFYSNPKPFAFQRVAKPRNDAIEYLTETENRPTNVIRPSIKTEIFVCDECGQRKRLKTSSRHWCDSCSHGSPVEMRPARDKRVVHPQKAAPTH